MIWSRPASRQSRFAISALVLLVLVVGGIVIARIWFDHYLRSDEFRRMISRATSSVLKAEGEFMPFQFNGTNVYSDGYEAQGTAGAFFSSLQADRLNAEFNLRGLLDHAWRIDQLEVQRVRLRIDARAARAAQVEGRANAGPAGTGLPTFGWAPNRLDLRRVVVRETDLDWVDATGRAGAVKGSALTMTPDPAGTGDGTAWDI